MSLRVCLGQCNVFVYEYVCVCVCVYVCGDSVRESEREKEREGEWVVNCNYISVGKMDLHFEWLVMDTFFPFFVSC